MESAITRWLKRKWAALMGSTTVVILNHLSVPSSALFVTTAQLPYSIRLQARPPFSGEWTYEWRWATAPIHGVTLAITAASYTDLMLDANAEVGVLARLECVGTCGGKEYVSAPYSVQVFPLGSQ